MEQHESILQKTYEMLKASILVLNKFPRSQKFTLADRIQNRLSDLLECLIEAFYAPPTLKREKLRQANLSIEIARHYWRLCFELGLINFKQYQLAAEKLNEIGRMVGGWLKSLS